MWHRWTEDAFWIWPQNIRGCIRYDVNYEKNNLLDPFWVYLSSVVICILIIINNFKVPHLFYNYSRCTKHSGKVTQLIMFIYIPTYIWILNVPTLILPFTKLMINMNLKKCDKNCWWNDTYKLCSPIVSKIHKKKNCNKIFWHAFNFCQKGITSPHIVLMHFISKNQKPDENSHVTSVTKKERQIQSQVFLFSVRANWHTGQKAQRRNEDTFLTQNPIFVEKTNTIKNWWKNK